MNERFELTTEKRNELRQEMMELLTEYDYEPTDRGLDTILTEWEGNKGWLIKLFEKHPNYNGKYQIVLTEDYHRRIDASVFNNFCYYVWKGLMALNRRAEIDLSVEEECFWDSKFYRTWRNKGESGQFATEELAEYINEVFPTCKAVKGQKISRIVRKIATIRGYDKWEDFNGQYVPFADAVNPLKVTRYTILSVNPMDYYTMSFGNNWASCHTIDKTNRRGMPNSYEGMYSSGTESYMLDESSIVVYTVDKDYVGDKWELQGKISRQMFHLGGTEDEPQKGTTLIQGRLYPQDNDTGSATLYAETRAIVQRVLAEIMGVDNMWKNVKGTSACTRVVEDCGTHYRDYRSYDNCNVSFLMVDGKYDEENALINIGHMPICPACGEEHNSDDNIMCEDCRTEYVYCEECGARIDMERAIYVNGYYFCDSECAENAGYRYVEDGRYEWYYEDDCFYDNYDGMYHLYRDGYEETVDGNMYSCADHAINDGYCYVDAGSMAGHWVSEDDVHFCEVCGNWYYYEDFNYEKDMCNNCAEAEENDRPFERAAQEKVEFSVGDKVKLLIPRRPADIGSFAGTWNGDGGMTDYATNNEFAYIIGTWGGSGRIKGWKVSTQSGTGEYGYDWIWDERFMRKFVSVA